MGPELGGGCDVPGVELEGLEVVVVEVFCEPDPQPIMEIRKETKIARAALDDTNPP